MTLLLIFMGLGGFPDLFHVDVGSSFQSQPLSGNQCPALCSLVPHWTWPVGVTRVPSSAGCRAIGCPEIPESFSTHLTLGATMVSMGQIVSSIRKGLVTPACPQLKTAGAHHLSRISDLNSNHSSDTFTTSKQAAWAFSGACIRSRKQNLLHLSP